MKPVAKITMNMSINGVSKPCQAYPLSRLLDVLRDEFQLTGSKEGCGEGECGACSVLLDGVLVNSCLVPAIQADRCEVTTIEGIAGKSVNKPILDAFLQSGGAQCGICTPGMVMATISLLRSNATPSNDEIREALGGNLCRCTGYTKIMDAVAAAAAAQLRSL